MTKLKSPRAWHERWEVWVFLVLVLGMYGFLMSMLYQDVMKEDTSGMDRIQKSSHISAIYQFSLFMFFLIMGYFVISLSVCAYYHPHDTQTIRTHRPTQKKVKDMSATQKKRHSDYMHATNRRTWYTCGRGWSAAKITTMFFSVAAFAMFPYVKKKKSLPLFVLLAVLLTPAVSILSASLLFLMANTRPR